jgi:hypothetical protein
LAGAVPAIERWSAVHEETSGAIVKRMRSGLERTGIGIVVLGVAILAWSGAYDMRTFRASPTVPDASHSERQESHGIVRYKTREQARVFYSLNIAGVSTFVVGAALLILHSRNRRHHA